MGVQRMQDLVCQSHMRIRDANSKKAEIVKNYEACPLTNVVASVKNLPTRYQATNPEVAWEMESMVV